MNEMLRFCWPSIMIEKFMSEQEECLRQFIAGKDVVVLHTIRLFPVVRLIQSQLF